MGLDRRCCCVGWFQNSLVCHGDRPFPVPQQADVRGGVMNLYMTTVLYPPI
jgi:hypothetical protein